MKNETRNEPEQLMEATEAENIKPEDWESSLSEFVDIWSSLLSRRHNMDSSRSRLIARDLVIETAHYMGGRAFYLPKTDSLKRAVRDAGIYHEFNGKNTNELARKHRMSQANIYNILSKQKKIRNR